MPELPLGPGSADRLHRLLKEEEDEAKVWLALRRGLLTDSQINEALAELISTSDTASDALPRRLFAIVVSRGWVNASDLDQLGDDVRRSDFATRVREAKPPPEVEPHLADPARRLAEFVLVERLGQGGAAAVWRAWDTDLRRWVAVKVPTWGVDSVEGRERFRREAQAAARLTHPTIVPVYRVAEHESRPYIIMQLVEGRTLAELRLPLDQALRAMKTVAEAVDYAHRQGVLHRDLKPGNMMVDRENRVFIFDFGLAHLFDEGKHTATGAVTGTASYMPPEQARGKTSSRAAASDVYSLGATLYELVTGRPPFEGSTFIEILDRVVREEPVPPRKIAPRLPRDVETIILKAMDKDPARRYGTALEFAEDLGRQLDGEPILARRTGFGYRVYRKIRKHRIISLLSAVGVGALIVAGVLVLRDVEQSRQIDREREKTAVEKSVALGTMREMARLTLDSALRLRRSGDTRHMRDFLPVLESAYTKATARGELAEVDYLMGRMHRALLDDAKALVFQNRALTKDPRFAPALYERILLLSEKHSSDLRRAYDAEQERSRSGVADDSPIGRELRALQEGILGDCTTLEREISTSGLTQANALAARGILAYHQGRREESRTLLEEAVRQDPLLEEAWSALARSFGDQSIRTPSGPVRVRLREEAISIYTQALEHDRGYLPYYLGRSVLILIRGKAGFSEGRDPDADYLASEEDLTRAIQLGGSRAEPWARRGDVRTSRGQLSVDRGQDPSSLLAGAEADFHEALRRDGTSVETWMRRGMAWMVAATYRLSCIEDPLPDLAAAEEHLGRALELQPRHAEAWMRQGMIHYDRAVYLRGKGGDALPELEKAEANLVRSSELQPGYSKVWLRLARTRISRAQWGSDLEASTLLDRAQADLDRVLGSDPGLEEGWMRKGMLETVRGLQSVAAKGDPSKSFAAARENLNRALALKKNYTEAWIERGHLSFEEAAASRGDAKALYSAALSDYREAVRINPTSEKGVADRMREATARTAR